MDSRAVIFCGGDYVGENRLEFLKNAFTVCADSGYDNAIKAGFSPNVLIGDFDSIKSDVNGDIEVIKYPVKKDATDTQLCVDYLIEKGIRKAYITCATGGRIDHTLANVSLLMYGIRRGIEITLVDKEFYMFPVIGEKEIKGEKGQNFSVFSCTEEAIVSEKGFEYEIEDAMLYVDVPRGISNKLAEKNAKITVKKGIIIAVHYR